MVGGCCVKRVPTPDCGCHKRREVEVLGQLRCARTRALWSEVPGVLSGAKAAGLAGRPAPPPLSARLERKAPIHYL